MAPIPAEHTSVLIRAATAHPVVLQKGTPAGLIAGVIVVALVCIVLFTGVTYYIYTRYRLKRDIVVVVEGKRITIDEIKSPAKRRFGHYRTASDASRMEPLLSGAAEFAGKTFEKVVTELNLARKKQPHMSLAITESSFYCAGPSEIAERSPSVAPESNPDISASDKESKPVKKQEQEITDAIPPSTAFTRAIESAGSDQASPSDSSAHSTVSSFTRAYLPSLIIPPNHPIDAPTTSTATHWITPNGASPKQFSAFANSNSSAPWTKKTFDVYISTDGSSSSGDPYSAFPSDEVFPSAPHFLVPNLERTDTQKIGGLIKARAARSPSPYDKTFASKLERAGSIVSFKLPSRKNTKKRTFKYGHQVMEQKPERVVSIIAQVVDPAAPGPAPFSISAAPEKRRRKVPPQPPLPDHLPPVPTPPSFKVSPPQKVDVAPIVPLTLSNKQMGKQKAPPMSGSVKSPMEVDISEQSGVFSPFGLKASMLSPPTITTPAQRTRHITGPRGPKPKYQPPSGKIGLPPSPRLGAFPSN